MANGEIHVARQGAGRENEGASHGLLTVIGTINWDVSVFEDAFASPEEEVPVRRVEEFCGGKGANVAVAAARILGPRKAAFIGALGRDETAKRQVHELKSEGVLTAGVVNIGGASSGRAYVLVNREGKKSIHTYFGANDLMRPSHLKTAGPRRILSNTTTLIMMDTPTDVAFAAAKAAGRSGAMAIYSPGVRVREGLDELARIIAYVDFLVLDKAELLRIAGNTDSMHASELIQKAFPKLTLVTTYGKKGCLVMNRREVTRIGGVNLPVLGMKAVNGTGSGDSFLGVFASYLSRGYSAVEAARWANLAGALKATRYETRGSPTRAMLQATRKRLNVLLTGRSPERILTSRI
jgi:ribokinase